MIYGDVEDNAPATIAFLDGCAMAGVQTATLQIVDSPGGHLASAFAMRQAVLRARRRGVHVTALIEGRCFSAATLVAGACDYVIAHSSASWCIHNAQATECGGAFAFDRIARMLRETNRQIAELYVQDSGLPRFRIEGLMIREQVLGAREAARLGFINKIVDES